MCLKIFTFKNQIFKNPVSALFKQLMLTVFGFLDSFLRPIIEKKMKNLEENNLNGDKGMFRESLDRISVKKMEMLRNSIERLSVKKEEHNDKDKDIKKDIKEEITWDCLGENVYSNQVLVEENLNQEDVEEKGNQEDGEEKVNIENDENKVKSEENIEHVKSNRSDRSQHSKKSFHSIKSHHSNKSNFFIEEEHAKVENKHLDDDSDNFDKQHESEAIIEVVLDDEDLNNKPEQEEKNIQNEQNHNKSNEEHHKIDEPVLEIKINKENKHIEEDLPFKENFIEERLPSVNLKKSQSIDLSEFTSIDIYITSLSVFKNLLLIAEGKKKEWIAPTIYSKCLGLELLSGIINQTGSILKHLPEFLDLIKNDLHKVIQKYFETSTDYIMGLKLSRLAIQIMENLDLCYDLLPFIFKFVETNTLTWQKQIGIECLCSLAGNSSTMFNLYKLKFDKDSPITFYDDILNSLTKVSYAVITMKDKKGTVDQPIKTTKLQKLIEMSTIFTDTDTTVPVFTQQHACKLLNECYTYLKDSFNIILENNNIKLGKQNTEYTEEQVFVKEMMNYNFEGIKNAMTALLINSGDDSMTQSYLILFQSFINIFGSIGLPSARDSYLNDLCKLAIPNNLENSLELKEKNMLIAKTLFNIAHCVNIIDSNSWLLLVETMQKIYLMLINSNNHMLKPNEEFEIDVIIKNLENTIRRYNPNFGVGEEKHVLRQSVLNDDTKSVDNISVKEEIANNNQEEVKEATNSTKDLTNTTSSVKSGGKGIFSSIKNVFGFSSKKDSSNSAQKKPAEENIDLQILATAIDALYIGSSGFEDSTIINIFKALYDSCTQLIEKNPVVNDSVITYLHFNITKMLEISVINVKRIHVFWDLIVKIVNFICIKNITNISRFSLDCLTIIVLYIITQYNTTTDDWNSENWQKTIFLPFKKVASLDISQHINLNIIYNLSKILQNCGQFLNFNGWNSYIETCQIIISKSDEIQCDNTFKLLEQIINEYNDYLSCLNCNTLINILECFAVYKRNHNLSYSAITMFWNVAAIIEKFQKLASMSLSEDLGKNLIYKNFSESQKDFFRTNRDEMDYFFNNSWKDLFNRLNNISSDVRFDVRKAGINIFADIYVAKNSLITNEISVIILNQHFLQILDKTYFIFEEKLKQNRTKKNVTIDNTTNNQLKTPKFSDNVGEIKLGDFKIDQLKLPEKKIKFDEETINKVIQPSADEKEWEDTSILIIQAIGKILKSFLVVNKDNKDYEFYKVSIIDNIKNKYCRIMRLTTPEVAGTLLKSLQEVYYANCELFLYFFESLWEIYAELGHFITTEFFMSNLCTMATSSKMVYNTLDILKDIFLKESNLQIKPDLLSGKNLENLLTFIRTLIKSSRNCEGIQVITNPQRILSDEKIIFDFTEKISKNLENVESWVIYSSYLSWFIKLDLNDHHSEAHCRKALEIFESFFNTRKLSSGYLKKYVPKLIQDVKDIACLRNKNDYVVVLVKNNKAQFHLWQFATFQLIKILNVILCGGKKKEEGTGVVSTNLDYSSNYMSNYQELDLDDNDGDSLNEIWEGIINCFETIFRQSESGYKTISRNILEELLKSCQEMEIQIINFIVNGLLPNSLKIPKEMQIKLLMLLDIGSNFDYNLFNLGSQNSSSSSSISRVCISNLFELCKYRSEDSLKKEVTVNQEDYVKIKIKIAKMSTPILIKRCKETMKKFLDDEIKSGSMPLARSRLEDIKYVLDKLKNLEINPNYLNTDDEVSNLTLDNISMMDIIMKNRKSHLFSLLPLLSEFITTKENDIKLIIKDIFRSISTEIGIK